MAAFIIDPDDAVSGRVVAGDNITYEMVEEFAIEYARRRAVDVVIYDESGSKVATAIAGFDIVRW